MRKKSREKRVRNEGRRSCSGEEGRIQKIEGARAKRIKGGDSDGEELNHIKSLKFASIRRDAL